MKATKEQIKNWKAKYGDVFAIEIDGKYAYFKPAIRKIVRFATSKGQTNPMAFAEAIIENCWIGGDEELKTNDSYFLSLMQKVDELVEIKEATLKKL